MKKKPTAAECLARMRELGGLVCACTAPDGTPRTHGIRIFDVTEDALYFFATRGSGLYQQLRLNPSISLLALHAETGEQVRLEGHVERLTEDEISRWLWNLFERFPKQIGVYYPRAWNTCYVFMVRTGLLEVLQPQGDDPLHRATVRLGGPREKGVRRPKTPTTGGFRISTRCATCGACAAACPVEVIQSGNPFRILQEHCLHCGACYAACPNDAIDRI